MKVYFQERKQFADAKDKELDSFVAEEAIIPVL